MRWLPLLVITSVLAASGCDRSESPAPPQSGTPSPAPTRSESAPAGSADPPAPPATPDPPPAVPAPPPADPEPDAGPTRIIRCEGRDLRFEARERSGRVVDARLSKAAGSARTWAATDDLVAFVDLPEQVFAIASPASGASDPLAHLELWAEPRTVKLDASQTRGHFKAHLRAAGFGSDTVYEESTLTCHTEPEPEP